MTYTDVYTIAGYVSFADNDVGRRGLNLYAAGNRIATDFRAPGPDGSASIVVSAAEKLAAGATIKVSAVQGSGGDLNLVAARLSAAWRGSGD